MSSSARHFLVTAGGTREKIDRVRDWGNVFTGNTGYRIASALAVSGNVDLVTSNRDHQREVAAMAGSADAAFRVIPFTSHSDLKAALAALMATQHYDAVVMTAAVSDYGPDHVYEVVNRTSGPDGLETWMVRDVFAGKVKSTFEEIAVLGKKTEKIVDLFRGQWGHRGVLVKFKLEVGIDRDRLIEIGQASRRASGADYLVANTLDMVDGPKAGAYLLSDAAAEWVARDVLPERLRALLAEHLNGPRPIPPGSSL
jgi:phosphopantothenoylcysteine synthetase/decarboxylase